MKTNYVIVVDYKEDLRLLEDCFLLGWNRDTDWFDCNYRGSEIITLRNKIRVNNYGLIKVDKYVKVYGEEVLHDLEIERRCGSREGYDCTVCKLEFNGEDWIVVPV